MRKSKLYTSAKGYDLYAQNYDAKTAHLDSFEKGKLIPLLGKIENKSIIDLGCGTGRLIAQIKRRFPNQKAQIIAVDISDEMLKITKRKFHDVDCVNADATNLPFPDNSFDIAIAAFLIIHLRDLTKVFDEIYRILRPGGIFILTNINQRKPPTLKPPKYKISKLDEKEDIIIKSFYHIPAHVLEALKNSFFKISKEEFIEEDGTWINQLIKAVKI